MQRHDTPGARAPLHVGVALDGAGWHPGAWRAPDATPGSLFDVTHWVELIRRAEVGLLDLATIEDSLGLRLQADGRARTDRVQGRLDATLLACRLAVATTRIGLVPTVSSTHTEPFHVSKAVATLDWVSHGRAGVRVRVSPRGAQARLFGRREAEETTGLLPGDLMDEAEDHVEVQRRLWDSWEDGAEIRDVATGRFVDVDRVHHIDFEGRWFSVRGPSITPRPPQGQPLVVALAHTERARRLVGRVADVGLVTPADGGEAHRVAGEVAAEVAAAGRAPSEVAVLADLVVVLGRDTAAATARLAQLDEWAGAELRSDAKVFVGTATQLADLMEAWHEAGLDGFRVRPAALPHDLDLVVEQLVPELQRRGLFRRSYGETTLRERFGLARPDSRYAGAAGGRHG